MISFENDSRDRKVIIQGHGSLGLANVRLTLETPEGKCSILLSKAMAKTLGTTLKDFGENI